MRRVYKESGCPSLWMFAGYLPFSRFRSKRLAIRLKALLEGASPAPCLKLDLGRSQCSCKQASGEVLVGHRLARPSL